MGLLPQGPVPARDQMYDERGFLSRIWERWFDRSRELHREITVYDATINPASVAANTTAEQTFTVTGLKTSMWVGVNKPTLDAGLGIAGARVSAANTLAITFINATGGAIDAGEETYKVLAVTQ